MNETLERTGSKLRTGSKPIQVLTNDTLGSTCLALAFMGIMGTVGCVESGPRRVAAPTWRPEEMADQAMVDLDQDGDGELSDEELEAAPGLKYCAKLLDTEGNGDGQLSREEILARLRKYQEMRVGLTDFTCSVLLDRRPLGSATVRLVPESFLGDVVQPLQSTSNQGGKVNFITEGIPMSMAPVGMYRVEITSPNAQIPAKYNTATTLGVELSSMSDPFHSGPTEFELRSRKR